MIKEELYVINANGERYSLDLPSPSGITLKWVSNLFSDISKLTCSYSYTFKLPMTAKNRRVLDIADDIRHESSFARVTVDAEFLVNGICLCPNANLYVSEVSTSSFSCVMTWRVLKAFEEMKSNSIDINELPSVGTFTWKTGDNDLAYGYPSRTFKNTDNILYPNYDAGLPYEDGTPPKPVVPVYRLVQLINDYYGVKIVLGREITERMGLLPKANFNNKEYYGECVYDDYLSYGVLPITGIGVSSGTQNRFTISGLEGKISDVVLNCGDMVHYGTYEKWVVTSTNQGTKDSIVVKSTEWYDLSGWHRYANLALLTFSGNKYIQNTGFTWHSSYEAESEDTSEANREQGHGEGSYYTHWEIYICTGEIKQSFTIEKCDNKLVATSRSLFRCSVECELRGEAEVRVSKADIQDGKAELKDYWWIYILRFKQGEDDDEADVDTYSEESDDWMGLRSISREETETGYVYKFDFGVKYDVRKLTIDAADDDEVGLVFWSGSYEEGRVKKDADDKATDTGITYKNTATFSYLRITSITPKVQFDGLPAEMDIIENLPEISCFDFVKNLFFLNGALPRVEKDGETISAMYYNQLRDRVVSGECLDWSKKMLSGVGENSTSTKTYNTNFGRENYFLMASNEKDKTDDEKLEEVELYGNGYGQIDIADKRLDDEKTIFTSVFYPGLRSDLAYPNVFTGRTIKVWDGEKNVQSDVNPILGYVNYRALDASIEDVSDVAERPMISNYGADFKHIRMNTFEPFEDMEEFYGYLKSILTDYAIIKEKFILNEFDLANFDESVPVYLQKYNCCFAVSTIQRDKSGISTVELVKLPYVKADYPTPEETEVDKVRYQYYLRSTVISFTLDLVRNYTTALCPICYDYFVNNRYEVWNTPYNNIAIPIVYDYGSGYGPKNYISRFVYPYEADLLKGDSYSVYFAIPETVSYDIIKNVGADTEYNQRMTVGLRVYYDDVKCEVGTHTLTFTKSDFGTYHIFKFIFDIYNAEGEKVEQVRKKMYYFVSEANQTVITDDFGDTHEEDDKEFTPYVEIKSGEVKVEGMIDLQVGGSYAKLMEETDGNVTVSKSNSFTMFKSEKVAPYSQDASLWDADTYSLSANVLNTVKLIRHTSPITTSDEEGSFEYHFYIDDAEVETAYNATIGAVVATFSKDDVSDAHSLKFTYSVKDNDGNVIKAETLTEAFHVLGFAVAKTEYSSELLFGFAIDLHDISGALASTRYKKDGTMYKNSSTNLGGGRQLIVEEGVTDVGPNLVNGSWKTSSYGVFSVDQSSTGSFVAKTIGKETKGEITLDTWEKTSSARVYWDGKQVTSLSEVMTKNGYTDETHALKIEYDIVEKDGTVRETKTMSITYHSTCYFD